MRQTSVRTGPGTPIAMKGAWGAVLCFAAILCAAMVTPAAAQPASALPEPIRSSELAGYAERLGLSDAQRRGAGALLEVYHEAFRRLRETEITPHRERVRAAARNVSEQEAERMARESQRIRRRIRDLDESFFSQLQPLLTEEQQALLPRVRMARERVRSTTNVALPTGRLPPDLSEVALKAGLSLEERRAIDPLLEQYERRLTRLVSDLPERVEQSRREMMEQMETLSSRVRDVREAASEEDRAALFEEIESILSQHERSGAELTIELRSLARQTLDSFRGPLSAESYRELRNAYTRQAYSRAIVLVNLGLDRHFEAALRLSEISQEQRSAIRAAAGSAHARLDGLISDAMDTIDHFEAEGVRTRAGGGLRQEYVQQMSALEQQALQLQTEVAAQLQAVLGDDIERLNQAMKRGADAPRAQRGAPRSAEQARAMLRSRGYPEPAAPITRSELREYIDMLDLTSDERIIAETLHETYREAYDAATAEAKEGEAQDSDDRRPRWGFPMFGSDPQTTEALKAADEAFFRELADVLGEEREEAMQRVMLARERRLLAAAGGSRFGIPWRISSPADLSTIARRASISVAARTAADPILLEYEQQLTEFMRRRAAAQREHQQIMESMMQADEDGTPRQRTFGMDRDTGERLREVQQRSRQADQAITELTNRTKARLREALPEEDAAIIVGAYRREAYPDVYEDPAAAHRYIQAALELEDLTAEQRSRLHDLALEYRPAYEDLTEALFQSRVGREDSAGRRWPAIDQMREARLEREELNARAARQLRLILTIDQARRIGPLPQP